MKETELAQHFVKYLSCYDLYFEVNGVDIVARNPPLLIAYEVKITFNFRVIEQALHNKPYFHYSYICVPVIRGYNNVQKRICEEFGLGLLQYSPVMGVQESIAPKLNRKALTHRIFLHKYQKEAIPGAPTGEANVMTPFKFTVKELTKYVSHNPGCSVKQAINGIKHHYRKDTVAINCVYQYLKSGVIDSVYLKDRKLFLNNKKI